MMQQMRALGVLPSSPSGFSHAGMASQAKSMPPQMSFAASGISSTPPAAGNSVDGAGETGEGQAGSGVEGLSPLLNPRS